MLHSTCNCNLWYYVSFCVKILSVPFIRGKHKGWRDGLTIENAYSSSRGPDFGSQHLHLVTQNHLCMTPASGDPPPSSGLLDYLHTSGIHSPRHIHMHVLKKVTTSLNGLGSTVQVE